MNKSLKTILPFLFVILIVLWSREGNLKEVLAKHGLVLVAIGGSLTVLFFFLISSKPVSNIFFRIMIWILLTAVPVSFLIGNPLKISIQFLIIYSVGVGFLLFLVEELKI